jgi:hypothetical protein
VPDAATRRNYGGASRSKRAASIRAESIEPTSSAQNRKDTPDAAIVWVMMPRGIRAKEVARSRSTVGAGSPVRVAATGKARRGRRALKGTRTSREASDRSWFRREATPLAACSHQNRARDRTGGAGGPVVPERAVAGPSAEAHADVGRTSRTSRRTSGAPDRQTDDHRRPKPMWPQGPPKMSSDAGPTRAGATNNRFGNELAVHRVPYANL